MVSFALPLVVRTAPDDTKFKLLELPAEILYVIADHLDDVSRICFKNTSIYLRTLSIDLPSPSPCAQTELIKRLWRDKEVTPKILPQPIDKRCPMAYYCDACRCNGHRQRCDYCSRKSTAENSRDCPREIHARWRQWTRIKRQRNVEERKKSPTEHFKDADGIIATLMKKRTSILKVTLKS